jgi:arylsulfatase A-like enzyme
VTEKPQNLIWICADDFAPYVSGAYSNPIARTPNLDAFAGESLLFENAFCTCPLSTPSNQSSWTGRYPRSIGVTLSPTPLPDSEESIAGRLGQLGFQVGAFGKTHYYAPRRHEFNVCAELKEYYDWKNSQSSRPLPADLETLGPWRPFYSPASIWLNSAARPFAAYQKEMQSHFYVSSACDFLKDCNDTPKRPFFLHLGICDTHSPFRFPVEYAGHFQASQFKAPAVSKEDLKEIPMAFDALTDIEKQGIQAAYYTAVEYMDSNIGRLLKAIKAYGFDKNSMIIVSSDHGYFLGQHGRFEKHSLYEEGVRVALLMKSPGMPLQGQRSKALVSLIDVAPSILDLMGLPASSRHQGHSMIDLLTGEADLHKHRDSVMIEYSDNAEAAVRTDRYKLIYCAGTRSRQDGYVTEAKPIKKLKLFDLKRDPNETTNLIGKWRHKSLINQLLDQLKDHLISTERDPSQVDTSMNRDDLLQTVLNPVELRSEY